MSIINYVKNAIFTKRESKKTVAKRKFAEFRGLSKDCTATELIEKYSESRVDKTEKYSLITLLAEKGYCFKFDLLNTNFEIGAEILHKTHVPKELLKLHRKWLLVEKGYYSPVQFEQAINKRLEESKQVLTVVDNILRKKREQEKWNIYPSATDWLLEDGEIYQVTMYDLKDKEFTEPYVTQAKYQNTKNGWDVPRGMLVIAWRDLPEGYVPQNQ